MTAEQRKTEEFGITEDDVMEIRQDISSMRFEMVDIFRQNGYKTPKKEHDSNVGKNARGYFLLSLYIIIRARIMMGISESFIVI